MSEKPRRHGTTYGLKKVDAILAPDIRKGAESRGFSVARLVTHWEEVAGESLARLCRPVEVSYARGGMGATLVLLVQGANAPVLEMEKERLRARVNACYGWNAIARVRLTQTAPTGFAEGQTPFSPKPKPAAPDPAARTSAEALTEGVKDPGLRAALAALGSNVLTKSKRISGETS
ncbi:DUF721 domain-containing protein [Pseudoroseicyclus tamaricis]|uniref:DUF721 domain-containing protein n=1 Tax=Pseudoroseicyclus tamaricis TaxID=2705421 RepID=A0A6B2JMN9_9RHOB|nr:DciA family protein [Pseudoroseicyclus tamaricis]NDV02861.1 DUF721 domain-containing protein [Pseudoroseicyclus tamaricis]